MNKKEIVHSLCSKCTKNCKQNSNVKIIRCFYSSKEFKTSKNDKTQAQQNEPNKPGFEIFD